MAYRAISKANASRMIDTTQAYRRMTFKEDTGRKPRETTKTTNPEKLDQYLDDVVKKLEKLQREDNRKNPDAKVGYFKRRQEIYDEQYKCHHDALSRCRSPFQTDCILTETLGLRPDTLPEERWASAQDLEDLELEACSKNSILENWSTPTIDFDYQHERDQD